MNIKDNITRYQPSLEEKAFYGDKYDSPCMSESADGEYVRYQDHQSIVAEMSAHTLNLSRRVEQLEDRLWTELEKSDELIAALTLLRRASFSATSSIVSREERQRLIDIIASTPEQCSVAAKAEGYSIGFVSGYDQCVADIDRGVGAEISESVLKTALLRAKEWMISQLHDTKERMLSSICETLERHQKK